MQLICKAIITSPHPIQQLNQTTLEPDLIFKTGKQRVRLNCNVAAIEGTATCTVFPSFNSAHYRCITNLTKTFRHLQPIYVILQTKEAHWIGRVWIPLDLTETGISGRVKTGASQTWWLLYSSFGCVGTSRSYVRHDAFHHMTGTGKILGGSLDSDIRC